jgi:RNA polymerase sigma-70 factor (ECF subfamily)
MNVVPWVTPRSDAQLLVRLASRDTTAFSELYDRYAPEVMGVISRTVDDLSAAEEIVKRLFLIVWERAEDLSSGRRAAVFREWLLLTAVQLAAEPVSLG